MAFSKTASLNEAKMGLRGSVESREPNPQVQDLRVVVQQILYSKRHHIPIEYLFSDLCKSIRRFVIVAIDVDWRIQGESRNIKGAHFAVGCGYSYHHLPKGAPL
jgi:hypothetical protein